jgi:hypothetical protein
VEAHGGDPGKALRPQRQIGHVAMRTEPGAECEADAPQPHPAPALRPNTVAPDRKRASEIAEHRGQRRVAPRCALSRRDGDSDLVHVDEFAAQLVEHRRRQRRQRAGAGERESLRAQRGRLQGRGELRDELAAVGEIQVVRAGGETRLGHPVALSLKRTDAVDDEAGPQRTQLRRQVRARHVQRHGGHRGRTGDRARAATRAQQLDSRIALQCTDDTGAEVAGTAEHDDAHGLSPAAPARGARCARRTCGSRRSRC